MSPQPTQARDWTPQISAVRYSQLYYESVMRAADRELHLLKRTRKQTQRTLRKMQRNLRAAVARRIRTRQALDTTRDRLRGARVTLVGPPTAPPPPPDMATAVLALHEPESAEMVALAVADVVVAGLGLLAAESVPAVVTPALIPPALVPAAVPDVSARDVTRLQKQLKHKKRAFKKARRQTHRVSRNLRTKRHVLASIKTRERSAISRRESAEAGLAGRILSMSTLARQRALNQTKVRPGISSGFLWPALGRLSQGYGCTGFRLNPPRGSCAHFHDGLDIVSYLGAPIRAAAVGVVSYIGWNPWDERGRAFIIVVAHPSGHETVYGHVLPTRRVRVGQLVRHGEIIGNMGNTGRSSGVHLHFELRRGRTTLDPRGFL
jgi:murein DD-endopeptidase MepM/ murein hydrolase activator NlpD